MITEVHMIAFSNISDVQSVIRLATSRFAESAHKHKMTVPQLESSWAVLDGDKPKVPREVRQKQRSLIKFLL
jgi:hypothetical protein